MISRDIWPTVHFKIPLHFKRPLALTFPTLELKLFFPLANLGQNIKRKMWRKTTIKITHLKEM
jgi:hypothetical protein